MHHKEFSFHLVIFQLFSHEDDLLQSFFIWQWLACGRFSHAYHSFAIFMLMLLLAIQISLFFQIEDTVDSSDLWIIVVVICVVLVEVLEP